MEVPEPNVKPFSSERRQAPQHNKFAICQNDPFDFPPGYRFCPYDHELILYYLKRKVMNLILPHNKIQEVNLYKYSPEELSGHVFDKFIISSFAYYTTLDHIFKKISIIFVWFN